MSRDLQFMTKAELIHTIGTKQIELHEVQIQLQNLKHNHEKLLRDYDMLKCLADEMEMREEERLRRLDYMVEREFSPWWKRFFK